MCLQFLIQFLNEFARLAHHWSKLAPRMCVTRDGSASHIEELTLFIDFARILVPTCVIESMGYLSTLVDSL